MKIEQNSQLKESLQKPLAQALHLAEDFLQASRAELMDNTNFKELDFAGLAHQAIDDAYEAAQAKNMILVRNVVNGMIWVEGNFGLLHRAILNLILNAVKFGPTNTEIHITLNSNQTFATLSVTDYGPGISKSEQIHLFKRFTRAEGVKSEGAGLGLYFVQTVVEKHRGKVSVHSDIGEPTSFQFELPINGLQMHEKID
jgi:signal transduction histidine kinase